MKVISGIYAGVTTTELDTLAAETAAAMTTKHPDYAILAARIAVSNLHKETRKAFSGKDHHIFGSSFFCKNHSIPRDKPYTKNLLPQQPS